MSTETSWTELDDAACATLAVIIDETLAQLEAAASTPTWTVAGSCDSGTEEANEKNKLDTNADEQKKASHRPNAAVKPSTRLQPSSAGGGL